MGEMWEAFKEIGHKGSFKPMPKKPKKQELTGLGGWLLVYIILLILFSFGFLLFFIEKITQPTITTAEELGRFTGSLIYLGGIFIFSGYCIYSIFTKRKNTKNVNKAFLITLIVISIISFFLGEDPLGSLFGIFLEVLFFRYWNNSDRIKNTFIK